MIVRAGSGWQYVLADLSLILFMVTAAALAQAEDAPSPRQPKARVDGQSVSPQAAPLAVYRVAPTAPPLDQWLRDQSADPRQQLTIVAQYQPGRQFEAIRQAQELVQHAGDAGMKARIVIEPGAGGATAALAFDNPGAAVRP